jgi:hypothetical protein
MAHSPALAGLIGKYLRDDRMMVDDFACQAIITDLACRQNRTRSRHSCSSFDFEDEDDINNTELLSLKRANRYLASGIRQLFFNL